MIIVIALYGIKSTGASFRVFLAETLYNIRYIIPTEYPNVWMRPAVTDDDFQY